MCPRAICSQSSSSLLCAGIGGIGGALLPMPGVSFRAQNTRPIRDASVIAPRNNRVAIAIPLSPQIRNGPTKYMMPRATMITDASRFLRSLLFILRPLYRFAADAVDLVLVIVSHAVDHLHLLR